MKKYIITIVLFCGLAYALPLIVSIELFFTVQSILLAMFAVILLFTQLPLDIIRSKAKKSGHLFSVYDILIGFLISLVFCVFGWIYFPEPFFYFTLDGFAFGGVFLIL